MKSKTTVTEITSVVTWGWRCTAKRYEGMLAVPEVC